MEPFVSRRFHLIIDAFDCKKDLSNKKFIEQTIIEIAKLLKMTIIKGPIIAKGIEKNPGLTAFAIIDFSHISIHTFTKTNEFCLDIFSCKEFDFSKLKKYIKSTYSLKDKQIYQSVVRYDEFDIDYNWNNFSPIEYLNEYYTKLSIENQKILEWYNEIYSKIKPTKKLLEIGGGATIYQLISASKKINSITFTDYLPNNLAEIKRWKNGKGFNWNKFVKFVLDLEKKSNSNNDIKIRKKKISEKINTISVLNASIQNDEYKNKFDIVQSNFAVESSTNDISEFKRMLFNMRSYLKKDGILLMTSLGGALTYKCGNHYFPAIYLNEDLINKYFKESGFKILKIDKILADNSNESKYHEIFLIKAIKR